MIRSEIQGKVGLAALSRESALNALNLEMVTDLLTLLRKWEIDPQIAAVVLTGDGPKAFCAGGDVKAVVQTSGADGPLKFFSTEYQLDHLIHVYSKPILVLAHGILMGGGMGLMAGADFRIITDDIRMAMPEVTIGLFPDVGGSFYLLQMPGKLGLYLGLTGTQINSADALFSGFATHCINRAAQKSLLEHALKIPFTGNSKDDQALLKQGIEHFCLEHPANLPEGGVESRMPLIDTICSASSALEIQAALEAQVQRSGDPWFAKGLKTLKAGSPTSAALIFEMLKRSKTLSLAGCFRMELNLALQCCRHFDFKEGVRALLIDKDQTPAWQPARLEDVTSEAIADYFEPLWTGAAHPLAGLGD